MVLPIPMIEPFCYEFGPFRLDPVRRVLQKEGEPVPIAAKAFDLLIVLVESRDQPISKEELMLKVWPESKTVSNNTFSVTLSNARRVLGETAKEPLYIVRTPGGYRFVADVQKSPANGERVSSEATAPTQGMS